MIYWNIIRSKFGKDQDVYFWFIYRGLFMIKAET